MKILIVDRFETNRNRTYLDMYNLFKERYEIEMVSDGLIIEKKVKEGNYDILWLGTYHQYMDISLPSILDFNKKPIIIDQMDNEDFIVNNRSYNQAQNVKLLSRCLPNQIEKYWGKKVYLLPYYIDANRYKVLNKTIDVSFICSIYGTRLGIDRVKLKEKLDNLFTNTNLTYITAEVWNTCYSDLLGHSKSLIIDGSRRCLTGKYLEASLSECVIFGEPPLSPETKIKTIHLDYTDINPIISAIKSRVNVEHNKQVVMDIYANKNYFFNQFEKILYG